MPTMIWYYIHVLLYYTQRTTCTAMAKVLKKVSHDRLTRMLEGDWSGQTLFVLALKTLFLLTGGYLILDDTVVEKPYSEKLQEACWAYSSRQKKVLFGIPVVLLVWSDGNIRIPIGYRIYKKGGPSKIDLALELLSFARNHLKLKPMMVYFDSWYAAERLLQRLCDYGWFFITQLKKNRSFEGVQLKDYRRQPYWSAIGKLTGGIRVFVAKHRRKYYASNCLSLSAEQIKELKKKRQEVEEVIRFCKSELSIEGCQSGYCKSFWEAEWIGREGPQAHHIALTLVTYLILEKERQSHGMTLHSFRDHLIIEREQCHLPALDLLRDSA